MRSQPVRVAIDLETTGLRPEQDAIIEIGAVKFAGGELVDTFESFVACGSPIPYRVRRLTGIAAPQLRGAPTLAELLPRLRDFLGDHPLVGHSVPFDAAFLRRVGLARRNPLVDTYELASALLPGLSSYTLAAVGEALGVSSATYHRALADAQLARDVLLALLARLDTLDAGTLAALGRLVTAPDWTPAYFVRQAARAQGISLAPAASGGTTLGALLSAQLGMDPAVLGLAVARESASASGDTDGALPATAPVTAEGTLGARVVRGVGEALATGAPLLVELHNDGEGTLACLVATLEWAHATGERVVVSAASGEAAQRLFARDLPAAYAASGVARAEVPAALAAEQESYLCLHRWFGAARTARDGALSREVARGLAKLIVWLGETRTGALAEVGLSGPELAAWELTRSGPEFADSDATCAYRREGYCFAERARQAAERSRVVITTHRALAAQLGGLANMLPPAARVVVLDAHALEAELRTAHTAMLERHGLLALLDSLATVEASGGRAGLLHLAAQRAGGGQMENREAQWFAQIKRARRAAEQVFEAARALLAEAQSEGSPGPAGGTPDARALRLDAGVWELSAWRTLGVRWTALARCLSTAAGTARDAAQLVLAALHPNSPAAADGVATDLLAAARLLERVCVHGERIVGADSGGEPPLRWLRVPYPQEGGVGGLGRRGRQTYPPALARAATRHSAPPVPSDTRDDVTSNSDEALDEAPVLHAAPVRVGPLLKSLWGEGRGVVLAAPALAAGGDFGYARGSLGAPDGARMLAPDLVREDQTLLCLPADVPEPNAPQFQRRLDEMLIALASGLGGRLVALFPSHAALRTAAQGLRRNLEDRDILLLAQGQDGSARQLWQTFRTESRVVLLGAGTFWETADFGDTPPACVVVTRLPFPALGDPLQAARAEMWPDAQNQFIVPHAALRVRYALGALAWSHRRRNAVVLFDRRAQTRDYGPVILGTLARCTQYQESAAQIAERVVEWVG